MAKKATTKAAEEVVTAEITETAVETATEAAQEIQIDETIDQDVLDEAAAIAKEEAPTIEVPEIKVNTEPLEETEAVVKEFVDIKENVEKAMESDDPQKALSAELEKINKLEETLKEDIAKTEKTISPDSKRQLKNLFEQGQFGGFWNGLYETDSINL